MEEVNKNMITKRTPYNVLNINIERELSNKSDKEKDRIILNKKTELLFRCEELLESSENFRKRARVELEIKRINEAYELIKNEVKRAEYNLKTKNDEEKNEVRQSEIEKEYSHTQETNLGLIANKERQVLKKTIQGMEHFYMDRENRKLRVKQTAEIQYINWQGINSSINEYQIKRKINGAERTDVVYTNLLISKLSKNPDTQKIHDFDYYECVVNELLSENTIEGSKYNYGYIGEVEKDKEGKYHITLKNKTLNSQGKEQLTVIMILNKQEKELEIEGNEI